jgi:hypothetical protein
MSRLSNSEVHIVHRIGSLRVTFWGALAMGVTAAVGALFGVSVG